MISDAQVRAEISQEWEAVKKLCSGSHRQYMAGTHGGGVFINETPPESFYNLPFLLAFAVLDQVLTELIDQGTIPRPKGRQLLGAKMMESASILPWKDYALVDHAKTARNDLAHEAKLLDKAECFRFIEAIELELKAWSVI